VKKTSERERITALREKSFYAVFTDGQNNYFRWFEMLEECATGQYQFRLYPSIAGTPALSRFSSGLCITAL
jgi:hypothetical protein